MLLGQTKHHGQPQRISKHEWRHIIQSSKHISSSFNIRDMRRDIEDTLTAAWHYVDWTCVWSTRLCRWSSGQHSEVSWRFGPAFDPNFPLAAPLWCHLQRLFVSVCALWLAWLGWGESRSAAGWQRAVRTWLMRWLAAGARAFSNLHRQAESSSAHCPVAQPRKHFHLDAAVEVFLLFSEQIVTENHYLTEHVLVSKMTR